MSNIDREIRYKGKVEGGDSNASGASGCCLAFSLPYERSIKMKVMKKLIASMLVVALACTLTVPAFAYESELATSEYMKNSLESIQQHENIHLAKIAAETGEVDAPITTKILSDLNGNYFELVEMGTSGYLIFDPQSGKYLEEALDSPSPYLGLNQNLYYFGPLNYYQLQQNTFVHTLLPEEYNFSIDVGTDVQSAFNVALQRSRSQTDTKVLAAMQIETNSAKSADLQAYFSTTRATNEYIPDYTYIKNAIYPKNKDGTCGYTAACLILNYWHRYERRIIDNSFLDSNGNLKKTGTTLQDKLLSYGDSNDSWGKTIRDALIAYCNEYGVSATSTYYITNFDIFAEVGRGRPVIVFGYFPDSPGQVPTRGKVFHAVTAYGTSTSGLTKKLIVHYGWLGYEHVTLDGGLVGSSTQFVLN